MGLKGLKACKRCECVLAGLLTTGGSERSTTTRSNGTVAPIWPAAKPDSCGNRLDSDTRGVGRDRHTDLEDVWCRLVLHLQHLLQVAGQLHVGVSARHGQEAQGHLHRGQGLAHLAVRLQLRRQAGGRQALEGFLSGRRPLAYF